MFRTLLLAAAMTLGAAPGHAGSVNVDDGIVSVSLIPGWHTENGTHMAALRISLAEGWKTYWRAPGDSGIPPQFDWEGSRNIRSVELHWPSPDVFEADGVRTIGYHGEVLLPLEFTPATPDAPLHLNAEVSLGVCETVCVPISVRVRAELTPGQHLRDPRILAAVADRPETASEAGVGVVKCRIEPISDGLRVTAQLTLPKLGAREIAVFELPDQTIWISPADTTRDGRTLIAVADMVPPSAQPFALSRNDLRITLLGGGRAVGLQGCSG